MKPCVLHWNEIAQAVNDRGLGSFVCRGDQLDERISAMQRSGINRATFCPMLCAIGTIANHTLHVLAPVIAAQLSVNGTCPLCYFRDHCEKCRSDSARWITLAADEQLAFATKLGLVASA